jgi:light-regulated signal transduction histidine kinase (bacteriophytochrome)
VEFVAGDADCLHLLVGDGDASWVQIALDLAADLEAGFCRRGTDELDNDLVAHQRLAAPVQDITLRREIEMDKERQHHELERSNADLEEFAYAASHDLKAPLRAIGHLAQWISEDIHTTAKPETMDNLNLLLGRVARLQMLLDGLQAYARVGRGHDAIESVDVSTVVHDIVGQLAPSPGFVIA